MVEELAVESSNTARGGSEPDDDSGGLAGLDALLGKLSLSEGDDQ